MDVTLRQAGKLVELFEDTPREQIQALLESGLLVDLRDGNITGISRDEFRWFVGLKPLNPPLLEEIGTVFVPAMDSPFFARKRFVVGNAGIVYVSEQLKAQLLGKIEEPMAEATLRYAKLLKPSVDGPIFTELGDKVETTLAQIHHLLTLQSNGEEGALLTNGWANIFYVRGINGELWAASVYRRVGGWHVFALSVARPRRWSDGDRVFSRNSLGSES